jgi:hypothetical protein
MAANRNGDSARRNPSPRTKKNRTKSRVILFKAALPPAVALAGLVCAQKSLDDEWSELLAAFANNQPNMFVMVLSHPRSQILRQICRKYHIRIDPYDALSAASVHVFEKWAYLQARLAEIACPARPYLTTAMRNAMRSYLRWVWGFWNDMSTLTYTDDDGRSDHPVISDGESAVDQLSEDELMRRLRAIALSTRQIRYTIAFKLKCMANCAREDLRLYLLTPEERVWAPVDPSHARLMPAVVVQRRILRCRLSGGECDFSSAWFAHAFGMCRPDDDPKLIKKKANLWDQWCCRAAQAYKKELREQLHF